MKSKEDKPIARLKDLLVAAPRLYVRHSYKKLSVKNYAY